MSRRKVSCRFCTIVFFCLSRGHPFVAGLPVVIIRVVNIAAGTQTYCEEYGNEQKQDPGPAPF